jgi:gliding motility-associated-like protein
MKKITLLCMLTLFCTFAYSQVLNQPANWPNTNWTVVGTYDTDADAFEADPTLTPNFAYDDDDDAGSTSDDDIAAESPVIDITGAFGAGETWLIVNLDYNYNDLGDTLNLEYWDADAAAWVVWQQFLATTNQPNNNFCTPAKDPFTSDPLDISGFTATQQSGFRYRLAFDDNDGWQWGFCFDSPTITSSIPPSCLDISNLASANVTATTADISWDANNGEMAWEIVIQTAGTGVPTGAGTAVTMNAPYMATGLNSSTNYEVYVRADCGVDGFSNWVGPINFTTLNLPPPAPVGVTCVSGGSSSFIFTEDFEDDPPLGWTGNSFSGTNGNWDITAGGNSFGTGPSGSFSGTNYLEYEASGNSTTIASAISPAIDLTTAADAVELSFYLHAFGDDIGTLNVNVGTSATGPFTTEYSWIGDLQSSETEAWVPVGVDLSAYIGQVIYIELSYGGAGTGFEGDLSIDLLRVEACGSFCIAPSALTVADVTSNSVEISWTSNSGEAEWEYFVQPAGTGAPTGPGTTTTTNPTIVTGLNPETDYEVYVRAICSPGNESVWTGPVNFTTFVEVDCNAAPVNTTYCYVDNDTTVFTFFASDGTSNLAVTFNAGQVENNWDELIILDANGNEIYNGYGNGGDVAGLTIESNGPSITIFVQSDGIFSCATQGYTPLDFNVGCIDPTAPPTCVSLTSPVDGATAVEIDQNITWGSAIGSPAGYILSVGTTPGGTDVVNGLDVGNVNSYLLDTEYDTTYYVTILPYNGNGLATGCAEESFTTRPDPNQVFNLVCANGPITVNHCYTNNDDNTFLFTSDTGFPIRLTFNSGTIVDDDDVISFYDGSTADPANLIITTNNAGDLSGLVIESTLGNLFMVVESDGFTSCASGNGTTWDWTAECLTCFKPTATYTVVEDCAMGDQFLIDVEISATGDANSITITDDFGSAPQVVTAPGVYTFGPYANTTPVVITVADTDDTNCILTSDILTQAFCPDQACRIINAGYDQLQTCDVTSTDLSATFMASSITSDTSTYTISDLQCPPDNLTGLPTSITLDDRWSSIIDLGFDFQYFGTSYNQVIIGANGLLSFDIADAGNFCPWNFAPGDLLPTPAVPINAIHGAFHDIDPSVAGDHYIEYALVGTAPERQFKVTFFEVPHFGCNDITTTQQIILYESSNVIDVLLIEKPFCPTWNDGGIAIVGIQNAAGTVGYAPPGRNNGVWEVTEQELWRFVPAGNPNYTFEWLDEDGTVISNDTDITVSPTEDATFTASITYALADGSLVTLTDDVFVEVQKLPEVGPADPIEVCDEDFDGVTEFDLTIREADLLAPNDPAEPIVVTYYETQADAIAGMNMLADPTVYTSGDATVYVRLTNTDTGCFETGTLQVVVLTQIDPANIGLEGECIDGEYTITVSPLNSGYDPATVTYDWSGGSSTDTDGSTFIATDDGEYTVTITTAEGCSSSQTFTVINSMCSFPQGISPNGDNLNDSWDLRAFRVQEVEIFNSHGRSVYLKRNYTNEWRGQTNDNDDLPVGTYFYVLRLENGEAKNGWVYINK